MEFSKHAEFFQRFAGIIASYRRGKFTDEHFLSQLALACEGSIEVVYSPFDHMPLNAELVIVGITPGKTQAIAAIAAAADALRAGKPSSALSKIADCYFLKSECACCEARLEGFTRKSEPISSMMV